MSLASMISPSSLGGRRKSSARPHADTLQVTHIYKITTQDLRALFDADKDLSERRSLLSEYQNVSGVLSSVQSEAKTGIMGDERDLNRRKSFFGENQKPKPQMPPFSESLMGAADDLIVLVVAGLALLSIITGMIQNWKVGWIEGVAILCALALLILITSINDWNKDRQFVKLQSLSRDEDVTVIRGKQGAMQQLNIWGLVVGDVVELEAGDRVPADCVIIEAQNLKVDESGDASKEYIHKNVNEDPFLRADSFVQQGQCRAVVVCVGAHSTRGIVDEKLDTESETPLQHKLFNLSQTFTFIGLWAAIIILTTSIVILCLQTGLDSDVGGAIFTKKLVENIILAFIIVMVAIPEGLPMTVGISLAYSIISMYDKDRVLVRDLKSPEKMGEVTEFCLGKTGTLTTEDMSVISIYAQNILIKNTRPDTIQNAVIAEEIRDLVKESVIYNNQCHIEMTENAFYVPVGNGTEVSLLKWLQGAEIPVHHIIKHKETHMLTRIPFSTVQKRSVVAMRLPHDEDTVRVYVKGAPEVVAPACDSCYSEEAAKVQFTEEQRDYVMNNIMTEEMAKHSMRAIALSYADLSMDDFTAIQEATQDFTAEDSAEQLVNNQTFIGLVALKDPLRPKVKQVIEMATKGGVQVRLVSGDNLDTVKAFAVDCGILSKEILDSNMLVNTQEQYCLNAKTLRERVGGIEEGSPKEDGTVDVRPGDQQAFNQIMDTLVVVGRADPIDKQMICAGLQAMQKKVAVIGEGLNDIKAFEIADVSFAMGSGTSITRNKASMVLLDNNFDSCVKAILRGRNIYANIKRFLQFQITVNFSCLFVIMFGMIYLTESPFNAVQLIWINLIMDVLGALALATAAPLPSVIHQPAITHDTPILQKVIWRQVYGVTLWNVIVMVLVMYFGRSMFSLPYQSSDQVADTPNKQKHFTIIFNTFVFLQFFNQINCRVVGPADFNVFASFFSNWIFILVLAVIYFVQLWASTPNGIGWLFETCAIEQQDFYSCVVWGSTSLLVAFLLKLTPAEWMEKVPIKIDENEALGADSKIMGTYQQQKQLNVRELAQQRAAGNDDDYEKVEDSE